MTNLDTTSLEQSFLAIFLRYQEAGHDVEMHRSVLGGWQLLIRVGGQRLLLFVSPSDDWTLSAAPVGHMLEVIDSGPVDSWDDVLDAVLALAKEAKSLVDSDS